MATTPASVTTARLTPRTRRADTPTIRPTTTAADGAGERPPGKADAGVDEQVRDHEPADTPASVTWASDTWPTNPVITTSDRQTTMPTSDSISACR